LFWSSLFFGCFLQGSLPNLVIQRIPLTAAEAIPCVIIKAPLVGVSSVEAYHHALLDVEKFFHLLF
jgi:hypothetical protein